MQGPERHNGKQLRLEGEFKTPEYLSVERVFPYCIPVSRTIIEALQRGQEPPVLEVILGIKSDESLPSPRYMTPISGKRKEGSSHIDAAYEILARKSTIASSPLVVAEEDRYQNAPFYHQGRRNFQYKVKTPDHEQVRHVNTVAIPVLSPGLAHSYRREKLESIVTLTLDELETAFQTGEYEGHHMVESSTFLPQDQISDEINIDAENVQKRNAQLRQLLGFFRDLESEVKDRVKKRVMNQTGQRQAEENPDSLVELYNNLVARLGDEKKANVEIASAFDALRFEIDQDYFRLNEKSFFELHEEDDTLFIYDEAVKHGKILRTHFSDGNFGNDILHALPLLVKLGRVERGTTTAAMEAFIGFNVEFLATSQERGRIDPKEFERLILGDTANHEEKRAIMQNLQKSSLDLLAKIFGYSPDFIRDAWSVYQKLIPNLGDSITELDPETRGDLFQVHELRSEVNRADLPELIVLAHKHPEEIVRFEAYRQLFIFYKTMFTKEFYDQVVQDANRPFRLAVQSFFSQENDTFKSIFFRGKSFPVRVVNGAKVIVDEKPEKSLLSVVRKALQERSSNIRDIYSYSVALFDSYKPVTDELQRIHEIKRITVSFLKYLKSKNPTSQIKLVNDKDSFDLYTDYLNGNLSESDLSSKSGLRAGSKGDLIVRRKMVIELTERNGRRCYCEFTFYPYDSLQGTPFMGWTEKLADDREYMYRRMREPIKGTPGLRSLYDLLFPYEFYDYKARVQLS